MFFVQVWLDCLAPYGQDKGDHTLEDQFMSLLVSLNEGNDPFLGGLPVDLQDDLKSNTRVDQANALQGLSNVFMKPN